MPPMVAVCRRAHESLEPWGRGPRVCDLCWLIEIVAGEKSRRRSVDKTRAPESTLKMSEKLNTQRIPAHASQHMIKSTNSR